MALPLFLRGSHRGRQYDHALCGKMPRSEIVGGNLFRNSRLLMAPIGSPILLTDAILTLAVRLPNPLSYEEIASLFGIAHNVASKICEPYKEFMRKTGEYGIRGVTKTG